jgi:hypothetical protein
MKTPLKSTDFRAESPVSAVNVLCEPLLKRFFFHFRGDRPTNRADRPEWPLAMVLGWIRRLGGGVRRIGGP